VVESENNIIYLADYVASARDAEHRLLASPSEGVSSEQMLHQVIAALRMAAALSEEILARA